MKNYLIIQGPIDSPGINGTDWVTQTTYGVSKSEYRNEYNACLSIDKVLASNYDDYNVVLALYDYETDYQKKINCNNVVVVQSAVFSNDVCKAFTRASAITQALSSIQEELDECNVVIIRSDCFIDLEIAFDDLKNLSSSHDQIDKKTIYTPYLLKNRALSFNDFYISGNGLDLQKLFLLVLKMENWGLTSQHHVYSAAVNLLNNPKNELLIRKYFSNNPPKVFEIFKQYEVINKFLQNSYIHPMSQKLFKSFELRGASITKNINYQNISGNFIFHGDVFNLQGCWKKDFFLWGYQGYKPTRKISFFFSYSGFKSFLKFQLKLLLNIIGPLYGKR